MEMLALSKRAMGQSVLAASAAFMNADVEPTLIQAVAAGLGVALLPAQAEKIPHDNVVFRELRPHVLTESCIAWNGDNSSNALKAYINIVSDRGIRMREKSVRRRHFSPRIQRKFLDDDVLIEGNGAAVEDVCKSCGCLNQVTE